jgi:hypothetical protein
VVVSFESPSGSVQGSVTTIAVMTNLAQLAPPISLTSRDSSLSTGARGPAAAAVAGGGGGGGDAEEDDIRPLVPESGASSLAPAVPATPEAPFDPLCPVRLDTLVTVIDSEKFLEDLISAGRIGEDKQLRAAEGASRQDTRYIVDLLIDQVARPLKRQLRSDPFLGALTRPAWMGL